MTDPRDPIDPQHLADERLRTRATLQRIAQMLGLDQTTETHELALSIEAVIVSHREEARAHVDRLSRNHNLMRCVLCDDEHGPFALKMGKFVCEPCELILSATNETVRSILLGRRANRHD